mmetsp:Transcript_2350/g.6494  ORF Transcript_2350/g.6494 Transcript_2350/m.6494 type:complete len:202 (-) Transcript_2350:623-1228(-)
MYILPSKLPHVQLAFEDDSIHSYEEGAFSLHSIHFPRPSEETIRSDHRMHPCAHKMDSERYLPTPRTWQTATPPSTLPCLEAQSHARHRPPTLEESSRPWEVGVHTATRHPFLTKPSPRIEMLIATPAAHRPGIRIFERKSSDFCVRDPRKHRWPLSWMWVRWKGSAIECEMVRPSEKSPVGIRRLRRHQRNAPEHESTSS